MKSLIKGLAVLSIGLLMTACGGSDDSNNTKNAAPATPAAQETTTETQSNAGTQPAEAPADASAPSS